VNELSLFFHAIETLMLLQVKGAKELPPRCIESEYNREAYRAENKFCEDATAFDNDVAVAIVMIPLMMRMMIMLLLM
jgi:hypothetical protein